MAFARCDISQLWRKYLQRVSSTLWNHAMLRL